MVQSVAGTTGAEAAGGRGLPITADTAARSGVVMDAAGTATMLCSKDGDLDVLADTPATGTTGAIMAGGPGLPLLRSTAAA